MYSLVFFIHRFSPQVAISDLGKNRILSLKIFASGKRSAIIGALSKRALSAVATAASTLLLPRQ
jgi:hypothetical protein